MHRWLTTWVDGILRPVYLQPAGPWTLADCWDQHEGILWELGAAATQW